MKKALSVICMTLVSILLLFSVFYLGLLIAKCIVYPDYIKNKENVCTIPALNDGFVPQGLSHAENETYIFSGYNGSAVELHLSENGQHKQLIPVDESGKAWEGHGGGIARVKDFVYLANDEKLVIFRLSDMQKAKDGDKIVSIGTFPVDTAASFCYADENNIYVGEFYRAVDYEINKSHAYTTPSGDEHRALVSCYPLAEDGSIADIYPLYSISVTSQVQGFAIKDNTVILSRSWGVTSSKLEFYRDMKDSGTTVNVSGKDVPLYYLDSSNLTKTVKMPAFSEDLTIIGDRVLVSFESACNKYIVGKFFFADQVISYPIG